jgi:aryl-alcohol dehydrogenase-like predicted oxidoreductase
MANTNRKHIVESVDQSLKRLDMDYVDVVFAHLFDANTPMEEICRGFNRVIEDGKAFYWATSNWSAEHIY